MKRTPHPTDPFTIRATAWWKSCLLTRKFLQRIGILPVEKKRRKPCPKKRQ